MAPTLLGRGTTAASPLAKPGAPAAMSRSPHDIALARRGDIRDAPRRANGRRQLRPHRGGVAVLRLAVMRNAGENRAKARRGQRPVEQVAQAGGRLELDGSGAELGGKGLESPFLVREREIVDVDIGDEDGVHGARGQQGGIGERHEPHAGRRRAPSGRMSEAARLGATTGGYG